MSALAKASSFTAISSTGNQSVTGVGFEPKALLFFLTHRTSFGTSIAVDIAVGYGMTDGANEGAGCIAYEDTFGLQTGRDRVVNTKCITLVDSNGTLLAEANIVSLDADGFTIDWTTNPAGITILFLAIGGSDVNAYVGSGRWSASPIAFSGVGFSPKGIWSFGDRDISNAWGTSLDGSLAFGVGLSTSDQHSSSRIHSNNSTENVSLIGASDFLLFLENDGSGNTAGEWDIQSIDADGFTLQKNAGADDTGRLVYLAVSGISVARGIVSQPASTGSQVITGLGFQPMCLLFDGADTVTLETSDTTTTELTLGIGTGATERGSIWAGAPSRANLRIDNSTIIHSGTASGSSAATDAEADLTSLDEDGFTLNWTTADGNARKHGYIAIGTDASLVAGVAPIQNQTEIAMIQVAMPY